LDEAESTSFSVELGDLIVLAIDGLFDNVSTERILLKGTREVKWEVIYSRITSSQTLDCLNIPITETVEHCNLSPDFSNYPISKDYDKTCTPIRVPSRFEKSGFP